MKANTIKLILILLFTGPLMYAQGWETIIDTDSSTYLSTGKDILTTDNNDYLILGMNYGEAGSIYASTISRLSSDGNLIWTKEYEKLYYADSIGTNPIGLVKAPVEGYYLMGMSILEDPVNLKVTKVDESGDTLWTKKHTFLSNSGDAFYFNDVVAVDGGYVLIGSLFPYGESLIVKLDMDANIEWTDEFILGSGSTFIRTIIETSDGDFVILGSYREDTPNPVNYDFLHKRNQDGNEIWTRGFKFMDRRGLWAGGMVKETSDGGFVYCYRY